MFARIREWAHRLTGSSLAKQGLAAVGVLIGLLIFWSLRSGSNETATPGQAPVASGNERVNQIISRHLAWAGDAEAKGLGASLSSVREYFAEAAKGCRPFAEEALGWDSKLKLASDYFSRTNEHERFISERFEAMVLRVADLERLIQATATAYLQHLDDVDGQLLVKLKADLTDLPSESFPEALDRDSITSALQVAVRDAVRSVQADFRGVVGREVLSFVAGEVVAAAATKFATSAGIIGVGTGSGVLTLGTGIAAGFAVDYLASKVYDAMYDPTGAITHQMTAALKDIEKLVVNGDGRSPGLYQRLRDYAARRSEARNASIRAIVAR